MQPLEVHIKLTVYRTEQVKLSLTRVETIKLKIKDIFIPLSVRESEPKRINLSVNEAETIQLSVREGGGKYPYYTGETRVTPKVREETELLTAKTLVMDNIIVEEIPYYETSNIKGITFIIGGN